MKKLILFIIGLMAIFTIQAQETAKTVLTKPGINSKTAVTVTSDKVNYLQNVTGDVQTQLNNKADKDSAITAADLANMGSDLFGDVYSKVQTILKTDSLITFQSNIKNTLRDIGNDIKAFSLGFTLNTGATSITLADQQMTMCLLESMPVGTLCTSVTFQIVTQGDFTADQTNSISLYKINFDGTYTKVAETGDCSANYKGAANSIQTVNFTSPYTTTVENYIVALLYNQSTQNTAPVIRSSSNIQSGIISTLSNANVKLSATLPGQNTAPTTITVSGTTTASHLPFLMIK